jgi:hypothetical protein
VLASTKVTLHEALHPRDARDAANLAPTGKLGHRARTGYLSCLMEGSDAAPEGAGEQSEAAEVMRPAAETPPTAADVLGDVKTVRFFVEVTSAPRDLETAAIVVPVVPGGGLDEIGTALDLPDVTTADVRPSSPKAVSRSGAPPKPPSGVARQKKQTKRAALESRHRSVARSSVPFEWVLFAKAWEETPTTTSSQPTPRLAAKAARACIAVAAEKDLTSIAIPLIGVGTDRRRTGRALHWGGGGRDRACGAGRASRHRSQGPRGSRLHRQVG